MVLNLRRNRKDELKIHLLEDCVFVSPPTSPPSPSHIQEPSSHDPILRGQVVLVCNAPRRATRIKVDLTGIAAKHGGDASFNFEQQETLRKHLEIDLKGERLDSGTHTWDFSFIIPSSTAVSERSVYGTVRHSVRAVLQGAGSTRDLSSTIRPIWLVGNPAPPGELPSGLEVDVRHPGSELGPISLHLSSPHLTVASLLFMGVTFEEPPEGLKIMSVQAFVRQDFEIYYSGNPVQRPPTQRKLLFYADSSTPLPSSTEDLLGRPNLSRGAPPPLAYEPRALLPQPLARLNNNQEWTYARVTRIPDDDSVRPSTLEGTDTPIRVKHALVAQLKYRFKGSKKDQILEIATNVTIASCCCLTSSLLLPKYRARHHVSSCPTVPNAPRSASVPLRSSNRNRGNSLSASDALSAAAGGVPVGIDSPTGSITPFHRRCLCNTPLHELVQTEGEKLCGAADSRSRSRAASLGRVQREASRSRARLGLGAGGNGSSAETSEVEGEADLRGRDATTRRKVGETFPVPPEETHGIEELPRVASSSSPSAAGGGVVRAGISWAAQGEALRPARRQVGTSMERVAGAQERGQTYIVV
ncbi:hypothetical protein JCM11641_000143 [Rhodosporidiobolus odoratus]